MTAAPPLRTATAAALLVLTTGATAACADAQSASSGTPPLPACEWCGTDEAPAELSWGATIAPDSEPGERLVVRGVAYHPDGVTPAPDVVLYFYQTNADGVYPTRGDETGNARRHGYLRGWIRTDDRGRYEIRTIRPGNYPGRSAAAHIHVTAQEPNGGPEYYIGELLFADDPHLRDPADEDYVLAPVRDAEGVLRARQDIVLDDDPEFTAAAAMNAVPASSAGSERVLCADTRRSVVQWRGTKRIGGSQEGTVRLDRGRLALRDGRITAGDFLVDMTTISVTSIPDRDRVARTTLERHLAHEEWFAVERFPRARLVLTDVLPNNDAARPYTLSGNLAIRDSVHTVTFHAVAHSLGPDEIHATADLVIDRQRWGVDFDGATSALRNLLVRNEIELRIELLARPDACQHATAT